MDEVIRKGMLLWYGVSFLSVWFFERRRRAPCGRGENT